MTALMQHASVDRGFSKPTRKLPQMKQSKTQTVNTQSSSLKVVRQTYLSSADAARSHIAVFDLEMSW